MSKSKNVKTPAADFYLVICLAKTCILSENALGEWNMSN